MEGGMVYSYETILCSILSDVVLFYLMGGKGNATVKWLCIYPYLHVVPVNIVVLVFHHHVVYG